MPDTMWIRATENWIYVCATVCLGGRASHSQCASFTKETKFWQLTTCTPAAWKRSTCISASLWRMRYVHEAHTLKRQNTNTFSVFCCLHALCDQFIWEVNSFSFQVKVTILRQPGCQPLHLANCPCSEWLRTDHQWRDSCFHCMSGCVQMTLWGASFLWMVGLYRVLTTLDN